MIKSFFICKSIDEQPEGKPETIIIIADNENEADKILSNNVDNSCNWKITRKHEVNNQNFNLESKVYDIICAPKRLPKKSANDLYSTRPESESKDPYLMCRFFDDYALSDIPDNVNNRVVIKTLVYHNIDETRFIKLYTMWFDGKPFGIGQIAGRGGKDHINNFVSDIEKYKLAYNYLKSLIEEDHNFDFDKICENEPLRKLTSFYGRSDVFLLKNN